MPKPYQIKAAGESTAELLIYGDIGESWWGDSVTAKSVVEQLQALDVDKITVRINSYGGAVADGLAIYNALRNHRAEILVRVEGVAISIASLIAMAGDTVEIAENASFMVHAPWGGAVGNAQEMREYADVLDHFARSMASSYARKTGKSHEEILALLTDGKDHWYAADEAVEFGLADSVIEDLVAVAAAGFDGSRFAAAGLRQIGEALQGAAGEPKSQNPPPAAQVAATHPPKTEEKTMPKEVQQPATDPKAANQPSAEEIKAQALAAESARRAEIRAAFTPFAARTGVQAVLDACLDDMAISAADAQAKLLAHLGRDSTPLAAGGRVEGGETEQEKFAKGAQLAVMARARLAQDDGANEFRSYSLMELGRRALAMHGVNTGRMDKMALVSAAFTHSSSDFGNLLANVANKAMLKGVEEAEETFQKWVSIGELPDFKPGLRVDLNAFPSLDKVADGGEYRHAKVGDRGETIQLATYGKLFSITRQAIINDDLDAFTRIPQRMGRAAIRTVGDLVYAILTSNPKMADNVQLFHGSHRNLLVADGITTASVDAMRVVMGTQREGKAALNIRLAHLLVPLALEGAANVVRTSQFEVGDTERSATVPNSVANTFDVIADARLDIADSKAWYGVASGSINDTIEVAYLDGNPNPTLEQQSGWTVDGVEFKVRLDAGVKALDYRTMAKNPGK